MSKENCNVELHFVVERGEIKEMKVNGDTTTLATALCFMAKERISFAYALADALKIYFRDKLTNGGEGDE